MAQHIFNGQKADNLLKICPPHHPFVRSSVWYERQAAEGAEGKLFTSCNNGKKNYYSVNCIFLLYCWKFFLILILFPYTFLILYFSLYTLKRPSIYLSLFCKGIRPTLAQSLSEKFNVNCLFKQFYIVIVALNKPLDWLFNDFRKLLKKVLYGLEGREIIEANKTFFFYFSNKSIKLTQS